MHTAAQFRTFVGEQPGCVDTLLSTDVPTSLSSEYFDCIRARARGQRAREAHATQADARGAGAAYRYVRDQDYQNRGGRTEPRPPATRDTRRSVGASVADIVATCGAANRVDAEET